MRMNEARYIDSDGNIEIKLLKEMTTRDYETLYKGMLYCSTNDCPAKIIYSGGMTPHFRTWKHDDHKAGCINEFDRLPIKRDTFSEDGISVDISYERRQNALKDAFKRMKMTEEELEEQRSKKRSTTLNRKNPISQGKIESTKVSTTLAGGDAIEGIEGYRGRNIVKRYIDNITSSDIGEIRLVMGELVNIELVEEVANLYVVKNDMQIKVVFEEAFIAEPSNNRYLNNFTLIERYLEQFEDIQFGGIGEIRKNRRTDELELVIYSGTDFKIDEEDMLYLADFIKR